MRNPRTPGTVIVSEANATPVFHAIERAALRQRQLPPDNLVGRLEVILEEFANILAAYVAYRDAAIAAGLKREDEAEEFHTPRPTVLQ